VLSAMDGGLVVDSAGTGGWHEGERMDSRALDALATRGYDGSAHRARQVAPRWLAQRDLVLAADRGHLRALQRLATNVPGAAPIRLLGEFAGSNSGLEAPGVLDVPDPYYAGRDEFATCLDLIERCCDGLINAPIMNKRS